MSDSFLNGCVWGWFLGVPLLTLSGSPMPQGMFYFFWFAWALAAYVIAMSAVKWWQSRV